MGFLGFLSTKYFCQCTFFGGNIFCKSNLPVLNVGSPRNCNMESENKWSKSCQNMESEKKWAKSKQFDKTQTSTNKDVKGQT